jgi:hypothetical protein
VQTLRAAGLVLAAADSIERLVPIAVACGCDGPPSPLDDDTRRVLGLGDAIAESFVAAGAGALRALLVRLDDRIAHREVLPRIAARLAARAPHCLWIVIATQRSSGALALMSWVDDRRPPRIAALVVDRARVVDSDAETLRALGAAAQELDILTHARWVEILGREALSLRFYRALERGLNVLADSSPHGSSEDRHELALLNVSRLLFLSFLEAKGWLNGDAAFIAHHFDRCMARRGRFHERVLRPLFFGTLNTPSRKRAPDARAFGRVPFLNGGLFARTPIERRNRSIEFSDDAYGALLASVFTNYRFTAREESSTWTEAAIDPEMLGHAFESLMGAGERRRTGAFYTPFAIVERVANSGLEIALGERPTRALVEQLTVLDPACGSGAFLVHVLERLAALRARLGDTREISAIRRDVLTQSIHGVDVNPTAVWLCELRLWLSVVIESDVTDPAAVLPLPNLDRNIRVGDSLSGRAFGADDIRLSGATALRTLRQRYVGASGARKESLGRQLDRAERKRAVAAIDDELAIVAARRNDLLAAWRGRDLFGDRYRPSRVETDAALQLRRRAATLRTSRKRLTNGGALSFSFPVHFADIGARGGFGLIVGNPPWVRLHNVTVEQRSAFRRDFVVAKNASWEPGALVAGASTGFAAQVDVAALFVERSLQLLAPRAALALLVPVKLWRSLAGGGVRRLLVSATELRRLEDFSDAPNTFDAAVYPSLIAARNGAADCAAAVKVALHHGGGATIAWDANATDIAFDETPGSPWILVPPNVREAFNVLRERGRPLWQSPVGRPHLGVKCGCNDAFVVELLDADDALAQVRSRDGRQFTIERSVLRPLLRGEHLRRWCTPPTREHIIWTHDDTGAPLAELPHYTMRWLSRWRRQLLARADSRHAARWWTLYRTESASCSAPRVVWADVGREPRASLLESGNNSVALNSCYVVHCADLADARTLAAIVNGPLARAWLDVVAEPARGGYRRYLGWTMALLPAPTDWRRARKRLGGLVAAACEPTNRALFDAALDSYRLSADEVSALVEWAGT